MKFYKCEICGKIVAMVKETPVDTMCCGQAMRELVPGTTDGATEKHVPGLDGDPLDVVGVRHRMLGRADLYLDRVPLHRVDGNVFLDRAVGYAGDELAHRLTAAHRVNWGFLDHRDDLAANFALVEFHNRTSLSFVSP